MDLTYVDYCWDGPSFRQRDLTVAQTYDRAYLEQRYAPIDEQVRALCARRLAVLRAITGIGDGCRLLDFGCGTGRFVEAAMRDCLGAYGHDLVYYGPDAQVGYGWNRSRFIGRPFDARPFEMVTFFDSLEHLADPADVIRQLRPQAIMVSVPECHYPDDPDWFMAWKHRRPGEHLWHWNRVNLSAFMEALGYAEVMASHFEDDYRPNPEQREPNILTAIYRRL